MSRRWLLFIAFLFTGIGAFGFLTREESPNTLDSSNKVVVESEDVFIPVLSSSRSFKRGSHIHSQDFITKTISQEHLDTYGMATSFVQDVPAGALVSADLPADTPLARHHFLLPDEPGYQTLLTSRDAISYALLLSHKEWPQISLSVGDRVDVSMIAMPDKNLARAQHTGGSRQVSVTPLLNSVSVLEVHESSSSFVEEQQHVLVLALTREQINRLILARQAGILDISPAGQQPVPSLRFRDAFPHMVSVVELRGENPSATRLSQGEQP